MFAPFRTWQAPESPSVLGGLLLFYHIKSLENTPNLLPVLKEAGVVDAGAMGFVNVWLGWCFQLMDSLGIKIAHITEEFEKLQNGG